jgi:glycosyltransferase involved in cell wall biosynthesis
METTNIAFVSDYVPRKCGIATFTADVLGAVASQNGSNDVFAVAINDAPEGYPYPPQVRFEIRQSVQADYRLAAEYLNIQQVGAVCLQHEYGIFGGACGSHILALLRRLRRPLVTTLHTVLKNPGPQQLAVLKEIARLSSRLVVMSDIARGILGEVYEVPEEKVVTIPHGIPDVPFIDPSYHKDQFGVEGRRVLITFGLLSPGKGLEYMIEALPAIVKRHPEVIYIILGATHPHIRRDSGESYRHSLQQQAKRLGVADNVMFVNRFVDLHELVEYLGAADIYVTPYLNEAQIVSGTLAYALGAGKATVSTPYWYATEMLADGRGRLVPFRDSKALAEQVNDLLDNETERHAIRKRAYTFTRRMVWSEVGKAYLRTFDEARQAWVEGRHKSAGAASVAGAGSVLPRPAELPEIDLRHLRTLTDDTGILQHARYATPDRNHGYCTDDTARALVVATSYWDQTHDDSVVPLIQTYLSFINYAMDEQSGRFRNFMTYNRSWAPGPSSEDSHGRALWGLGSAVASAPHEPMVALSSWLFRRGLELVDDFSSPRAWAFAIIGIHAYLRRFGGDSSVRRSRERLSHKLLRLFKDNITPETPWCEPVVTYCNAKLPHALLMSGKWLGNNEMIDVGKNALEWLLDCQTDGNGHLSFIGTNGWYQCNGHKASYDQQPVEAHGMVDACIEAWHVTRERRWIDAAHKAFNWFLGENDLRAPLHDFTTGGCRDGLHADRVNQNQGAESTLSWLMSLLLMHELQAELALNDTHAYKGVAERPFLKGRVASSVLPIEVKKHASPDSPR